MRRAGHVQKTHTYMDTDTDMCITMSMIKYIHRGMPLTEAIREYDSDMNQNEIFQQSFATGPKCMFIGCHHEIYYLEVLKRCDLNQVRCGLNLQRKLLRTEGRLC